MNEGIEKFTLFWGASDYGRGSFDVIKNQIKIGDEIVLKEVRRGVNIFRIAYFKDMEIAQLSKSLVNQLNGIHDIHGFVVSAIYAHTFEDTIRSDEEFVLKGGLPNPLNARPFQNKWNEESKKRGYIFLIDFSGYGKIIN